MASLNILILYNFTVLQCGFFYDRILLEHFKEYGKKQQQQQQQQQLNVILA